MSNEGDIYTIEKIIKHRVDKKRGKLYFIKWQGWDQTHNTWEPEDNILDKELLAKYAESKKRGAKRQSGQPPVSPPSKQAKLDSDQESIHNLDMNNSFTSASDMQSEGQFDVEDADKDDAAPPVSVPEEDTETEPVEEPASPQEPQEDESPASPDEEPVEPKNEEVVEKEEEKVEVTKTVEVVIEKTEKREDVPIDFYACEVTETEYRITQPNDPGCEVKIQVPSEPCITSQNDDALAASPFETTEASDEARELNTASVPFYE